MVAAAVIVWPSYRLASLAYSPVNRTRVRPLTFLYWAQMEAPAGMNVSMIA
jgi:hypothetical protein